MPIRLSDIKRDVRSVTLNYGGETLNIQYKPSEYTAEAEDMMQESIKAERPAVALARFLEPVLSGWDLVDDNGQEIPHTFEALKKLPSLVLSEVVTAIANDLAVGAEDRKNLGGGSFQKGK